MEARYDREGAGCFFLCGLCGIVVEEVIDD